MNFYIVHIICNANGVPVAFEVGNPWNITRLTPDQFRTMDLGIRPLPKWPFCHWRGLPVVYHTTILEEA